MRLSTINPTGTRRSRKATSSVIFTRAPEVRARTQMLIKLRMMASTISTATPTTTITASTNPLTSARYGFIVF